MTFLEAYLTAHSIVAMVIIECQSVGELGLPCSRIRILKYDFPRRKTLKNETLEKWYFDTGRQKLRSPMEDAKANHFRLDSIKYPRTDVAQ